MKRILVWSTVLVLCAGAVAAQTTGAPHPVPGPTSTATSSATLGAPEDEAPATLLQAMRTGFHPGVARYLGVASPADLDDTEVGRVIRTYIVALDQLRQYDGVSPVTGMLSDAGAITRLVSVRGKVASALVLNNVGGKWEVGRIGESNRAAAIDRITTALASTLGVPVDSTFLVQVAGLQVEFVAFHSATTVELASLWDLPGLGLVAGQPQAGEAALASLVVAASNLQTMP